MAARLQTLTLLNATAEGPPISAGNPFEILRSMVEDELIRDIVTQLGVSASDANTDAALRERFLPDASSAGAASAEQLERDFQEAYTHFLTRGRVSDEQVQALFDPLLHQRGIGRILGRQSCHRHKWER